MKSENFKLVLIFLSAFITFVSCSPSSHKKEFTFHGQSYTKLINIHGGDNLVIGSKPTQTVAKSDMKYICTKFRYDQISYERSDYKTVVKKAGIDDDSYFVLITRAVWQCKEDVARIANSQLSNFVRVENDLISIKPIAAVEFCDGVFVSATRYIGQRYAVKIKEIKYLKSTSTDPNKYETAPMNVVQYDGLIALEEAPFPPYQPRVPSKQLTHFEADVPQPVYGECSHDIPNNKEAMQFTLSTNSGRAFAIGTKQKGDLESPPPGSSCPECFTINPGTPYHSLYRTEVIEILESGFEGIMNDEEFSKVFVIASRTVHVCHSPDKPEAEFIRVEQRVIGLAAIKYLRLYSHTITQMTAIEMDANSATMSAMFTEVKYIQADGSALKQLKVPRRKLFIEEEVSTHIGKAIDIAYLIKSTDVVSRTLISDEGYDLRIGEPTRVAKMNNEGTVDCQEYAISKMVSDETSNHMWLTETKVFMKVNGDNTFHTLKQIAEDRQKETFGKPFYELVQRKTWKCIIEPAPKEKFIRVESRIRVLVPVRELESYDGVKIFKTRSENGEWSVEIVEVRHLSNEYPHDSIRLSASNNTFNEINDPSDIMKYSSDNEPSLLKKSGDEMVHTMGAGAKKGLNVRGTRSNDADSQTIIKNIGPGRHSIKFNLGVVSHIGNAEDIADCDVLQTGSYSSDKILPAFTIIDAQQNGKAILTSGTKAVHDSVFKDLSAEIWKCTIRGVVQENTQFLRVVYDHTLKTNPEYDIGTVEHLQRDEVWLEVEDGQPVVRVRETKYLDIVNNYRVINYIGLHLLTPKLISSEWKSGTQIIENYQSISDTVINRELMGAMQYFDDLPHSLSIEAYDTITIDTRWTKTFGNAEMTLRCEKDSTGRFTSLKTKMTVDNDNKNISAYFINEISTEFWICSDQTNENGIVRVHHQFSLNNWWSIKEIRYFYGVTIFGGNTATISRKKRSGKKHSFTPYEYEIIVIRYHENGANYPIVKYDGKLTFKDGSRSDIKPNTLNVYGVRDVYYTLDSRAVYRKQISQIGHSIQILPFSTGYAASEMDKKSKQLVIDCIQLSSAKSSKYRDDIRPMIMWNQNAYGSELPVRSLMTPQQLNECFQHHFKIQMCGKEVSDVKPIYRVESTLTTRDENCKLAVVYYHDGVTVVENNGKLEIKATKFYNDQFQPIKFNGFTKPLIPLQSNNGAFREINYMPDVIRVTEVTHGSEDGNTYEIGSRWEYELVATADAVKCEKTVGRDYKKNYATKVSFVKDQKWTVISDLIDSRHFTDVRQTIYECKRGEQLVFLRIVNEYVEKRLHESRYIYHHDGVEVGALVYPNSERTQTKIREVKFVDPSTEKILKYVGELYVVTEMKSIARRLYDGPASLIEGKLLAYEKLSDAKAMDVYSLDSLRTFMDGKKPIEKRLEAVRYGNDNKYLIYTNVEYMNGLSVYQVGRLWDAVYTADSSNPLICLEDRWNTKTVFESYNYKYILPRVIEFYGGEMYELDFHSMRQLISKINLKVWICANRKDTLLRLELSMYIPSVNMSGYIHPHNIGIWLDDTQKNSVVLLRETFFVTPMSSKILKYEGALQLLESYVPDVGSWD